VVRIDRRISILMTVESVNTLVLYTLNERYVTTTLMSAHVLRGTMSAVNLMILA
jgi:hypothetical protein